MTVPARESQWALVTVASLEVLALAVWVGGLIAIIGAVIPAVFNSVAMEPGGRLVARVFDGYNRLVGVAVVVLVACTALRLWFRRLGDAAWSQDGGPDAVVLGLMVAVAGLIVFVLAPEAARLQELAFVAPAAEKEQAYDAFFRIHRPLQALYVMNLGLGISLLVIKVRAWVRRPAGPGAPPLPEGRR